MVRRKTFARIVGTATANQEPLPGDDLLLSNIASWLANVKLGGQTWNIPLARNSVLQAPRTTMNVQSYAVLVSHTELLAEIVKSCERWSGKDRDKAALQDQKIVAGVLTLHRRQFVPNASQRQRLPIDARRRDAVAVRDSYWLDIWVATPNGSSAPVVRVYHDSAGPVYFRQPIDVRPYIQQLLACAGQYASPREVTLNWHDAARVLGLDTRVAYLRACLIGAGFLSEVLYQEVGPAGQPQPPFVGTFFPGIDGTFMPTAPVLYDPSADHPLPGDLGPSVQAMTAVVYQVRDNDHSPWRTPTSTDDLASFHAYNIRKAPVLMAMDGVPRPPPPSKDYADALGRIFASASGGRATYIGQGYFVFRSDDFAALAAGSGKWGSEEQVVLFIEKSAESGGLETAASGVGAAGAALNALGNYLEYQEGPNAVSDCVKNSASVAECKECISDKLGTANGLQISGDFVGAVGGALGALAATGPVGWIIGAVVVVVCVTVMVIDIYEYDDKMAQCYGQYGQG